MTDTALKCEQRFGGTMYEQKMFQSEQQARDFACKLSAHAPDIVCRIETLPLQPVWN